MTFELTSLKPHDGDRKTNSNDVIEDEQCVTCMDWIIFDWYIVKSFMRNRDSGHSICLDCLVEIEKLA